MSEDHRPRTVSLTDRIRLERVRRDQRDALHQLVDNYLAELSRHRERSVGPSRASEYEYLPLYWEEPGRHPFFLVSRGRRVGFVLVREVLDQALLQMSDFYVCAESRREGLGRRALAAVWERFPGTWELQVHPLNEAAAAFWPRCIERHAAGAIRVTEVEEEDGRRLQYEFEIPATTNSEEKPQ